VLSELTLSTLFHPDPQKIRAIRAQDTLMLSTQNVGRSSYPEKQKCPDIASMSGHFDRLEKR